MMLNVVVCILSLIGSSVGESIMDCSNEEVSSTCFVFMDVNATWAESKAWCAKMGMVLASVPSASEATLIEGLVKEGDKGTNVWIGFNDQATEGTFVWDDGDKSTYTNWASDQPSQGDDEDCVAMSADNELKWDDLDCGTGAAFVCRMLDEDDGFDEDAYNRQDGDALNRQLEDEDYNDDEDDEDDQENDGNALDRQLEDEDYNDDENDEDDQENDEE